MSIKPDTEIAPHYPTGSIQSPFTVGDIVTAEVNTRVNFECALYWHDRKVATIDSSNGAFEQLDWEWLDETAQPAFDEFVSSGPFHTRDLFVGSMVAFHCNIEWLTKECMTDTLFRFSNDSPETFQRIKEPFSQDLKARIINRYGPDIYFYNEILGNR